MGLEPTSTRWQRIVFTHMTIEAYTLAQVEGFEPPITVLETVALTNLAKPAQRVSDRK